MKTFQKHENGPFKELDGSVYCELIGTIIEHPAVLVDLETGTVLKNTDEDIVKAYFAAFCSEMLKIDPKSVYNYKVIVFDKYKNLSVDEICTLMNYMRNSIGPEKMRELLSMKPENLKGKLSRLAEIGW